MIRVTDATFPFICLQTAGACTAEEIATIKPIYERAFSRGLRHVSISDARLGDNSASQRRIWAEWTNATMADAQRYTAATVIMLDSTLLRAALTALNWVATPKIPQHVAGTNAEMLVHARAIARAEGMDIPQATFDAIVAWLDEGRTKVAVGQR